MKNYIRNDLQPFYRIPSALLPRICTKTATRSELWEVANLRQGVQLRPQSSRSLQLTKFISCSLKCLRRTAHHHHINLIQRLHKDSYKKYHKSALSPDKPSALLFSSVHLRMVLKLSVTFHFYLFVFEGFSTLLANYYVFTIRILSHFVINLLQLKVGYLSGLGFIFILQGQRDGGVPLIDRELASCPACL